jgi:hypothetical protein
MRSPDSSSPLVFAVSTSGVVLRRLSHPPLPARYLAHARPCLDTVISEQTRQDSWRAIEIIADRHNRRVECYLQRRRHRPWRNRGS